MTTKGECPSPTLLWNLNRTLKDEELGLRNMRYSSYLMKGDRYILANEPLLL